MQPTANLEIYSRDKSIYWRVPLMPKALRLGRMPGLVDIVTPPQDNFISKVHAIVELQADGRLKVTRAPEANNPIYRVESGKPPAQSDDFTLGIGESFQIGGTVFRLCPDDAKETGTAEEQRAAFTTEATFKPEKIREFRFADANHRVEALADLPQLILSTQHERMLEQQVLDTLLKGLPEADVVAIVHLDPNCDEEDAKFSVRALKCREQAAMTAASEHRPSRRLVYKAIRYLQPTHHIWKAGTADPSFTVDTTGMDWALCVPMPDSIAPDLGVYAAGRLRSLFQSDAIAKDKQCQGDMKFAQLTADIYAALRRMLELQNQQRALSRFLPMPIVAQMFKQGGDIDEFLQARECEITVLFCDLRGSCRIAEGGADDLKALLDRLSEALAVMTDNIVSRWGVIGDFQGDAVMAFWGWPMGDRQVDQAAQAALNIAKRFRELSGKSGSSVHGMACGIGIAHGKGIAGRLGTSDQYKIGAFGPVVNLAARLESLTKHMQVPILVDGAFASKLSADQPWARKRKVARIQPAGMDTPVDMFELLPSEAQHDALPDHLRKRYERALEVFAAGKWTEASNLLGSLPNDGPSVYLKQYIDKFGGTPPAGWDGTLVMQSK